MVLKRLLLSGYLGFIVFIALSLLFGQTGLIGFKDINEYKGFLQDNIDELIEINRNLTSDLKALSTSPETLKLYAREFGYFEKNEEVVKIQGAPEVNRYFKLGSLLKRNDVPNGPSPLLHIIGFTVAFISFGLSFFFMRKQKHAHFPE
jgi:hypothetical protein